MKGNKYIFRNAIPGLAGYLMICVLLVAEVSFSRYVSGSSDADTARVAAGEVTVIFSEQSVLTIERKDNEIIEKSYDFSVSNAGSGRISEVAIRYDVIIEPEVQLPEGVSVTLDGKRCTFQNDGTYILENAGCFPAGSECSNHHVLCFFCNFDYISESSTTDVKISVQSFQVD